MKSFFAFFFLIHLGVLNLCAQKPFFEKHFSSYQSLCQAIIKDTLWIGSTNCLMKILISENRILQIYSKENSPITKNVTAISIDHLNRVCIIIDRNTIALLSSGSWTSWQATEILSIPPNGLVDITDVAIADGGEIYCYEYYQKKIYSYSNSRWVELTNMIAFNERFGKFIQSPDGHIWWMNDTHFGSAETFITRMDTLMRIRFNQGTMDVIFLTDITLYSIEENGRISKVKANGTTIIKAKIGASFFEGASIGLGINESVFISVGEFLYVFKDKSITQFANDKIDYAFDPAKIIVDESERVWMNYNNRQLVKFENNAFTIAKYGIVSDRTVKANTDKTVLWFNTNDYVCNYNVTTRKLQHFDLPVGIYTYEFAEGLNPDNMWLATSKGLMFYDGIKWNALFDSLKPMTIYDLKVLSATELVGMMSNGNGPFLGVYDINSKKWKSIGSPSPALTGYKFFVDKTKRIWAIINNGLTYFENGKWNYLNQTNSSIPNEQWIRLAFDSNNKLYVLSDSHLYSYDGLEWNLLLTSDFCDYIGDVFLDSGNRIWLMYSCPGLDYYDGQSWHHFDSNNSSIPDIQFNNFEEDANGNIWTSTNPSLQFKLDLTNSKNTIHNKNELIVFPNPAKNVLHIKFPESHGQVNIYNSLGTQIFTSKVVNTSYNLSLDNFLPGFYTVVCRNDSNKIISNHFIKN